MSLDALTPTLLSGDEPFTLLVEGGRIAALPGMTVLDFWRWSASDLLSNTMRGIVAEYLVASALGLTDDRSSANEPREEWRPHDLETKDGLKIEVKSAAYIQRWAQKELSKISFNIPETRNWNAETNAYDPTPKRQADIYIFCLLKHQDQSTLDILNVDQWEFYVVPSTHLGPAKSITLARLQALTQAVGLGELRGRVGASLKCCIFAASQANELAADRRMQ